MKILLIEDEKAMSMALQDALEHNGYIVFCASDGELGLELAQKEKPDLVLLDVMLPGMDGFEVCRKLRSGGFGEPVLMLTARSEEIDRVVGLEIGADDYIVKPFSIRELMARVKAHLRRSQATGKLSAARLTLGDLTLDFTGSMVIRGETNTRLTSTELAILRLLVEKKDEIVSREQIMNLVWGYDYYPDSRTVDTHILNLRHKLEEDPGRPKHLITFHGLGYKFIT